MTGSQRRFVKEHPRLYRGALAARRAGVGVRRGVAMGVRPLVLGNYLRGGEKRRLHLGAGPHVIPGWLNTDLEPTSLRIAYLDATRPFRLPDASMELVFTEHMIEHVPYASGLRMLRECARVLRPSGRIRVATPDVDAILALARTPLTEEQREYVSWFLERNDLGVPEPRGIFVVNHFFSSWGHRFLYDRRTLAEALERSGFGDVRAYRPGESDHAELRGLERHGAVLGSERWNDFETMVLEAERS